MRADPLTSEVAQVMRPAPHYSRPGKATSGVRLLGEHEARGPGTLDWDTEDYEPASNSPFTHYPPAYAANQQSAGSLATPNSGNPQLGMIAPQFALYAEVEGWGYDPFEYDYQRPTLLARLARLVKKLMLPVTLVLMGAGLFLIANSPMLARGAGNGSKSGMKLSGYRDQSASNLASQPSDAPPVIDARSDSPALLNPEENSALTPSGAPYDVVGAPSISVAQIERVLQEYGSPAAGKGQALYDLGTRYGIDPAYALAFFVHESGCGTKGVARHTRSLGNIRWTPGFDNYEGYRKYPTWEAGMEDWYKLITRLYIGEWNLRTVDKIIPVYAPWGDNNNPPAYIKSVKGMVDRWRGR